MTLNVTVSLVGKSFVFNEANTENILDVIGDFGDIPCDFTLEYDETTYAGSGIKVGDEIIATFDEDVVLPTGMCLDFICEEEEAPETNCVDEEIEITEGMRLAVLDNEGCLKGWVLLSDILKCNGQKTLCEVLCIEEIPVGNLVASDRILTTGDNCEVKAVPQSDIVCD